MLDLTKIQSDTYTFSLVLPTGEIRDDVKITVRGDNHPKVKEVSRKLLLEGEQRRAVSKRRGQPHQRGPARVAAPLAATGQDGDAITEEDLEYLEAAGLARAVSRVESMKGLAEDGKEVGSDEQAVATVLKKYDWLLEQVVQEAADAVNFCS